MRYSTVHLLVFVVVAAFVFALCRHPAALWRAVVPLIGGIFVVLPVLGTVELLNGRDSCNPNLSWRAVSFVVLVGTVGMACALVVLSGLLELMR